MIGGLALKVFAQGDGPSLVLVFPLLLLLLLLLLLWPVCYWQRCSTPCNHS
jgi:hypothetical protein